jgi:hypothetical protein
MQVANRAGDFAAVSVSIVQVLEVDSAERWDMEWMNPEGSETLGFEGVHSQVGGECQNSAGLDNRPWRISI